MSQCRLTAEISIEIDELKNIDISALTESFANTKHVKSSFNKVMSIIIILINIIKNIYFFHFRGASPFHLAEGLQSSKAGSEYIFVCYILYILNL